MKKGKRTKTRWRTRWSAQLRSVSEKEFWRSSFQKNRAEAKRMSIYEYDEERHMRQTRAEGYEDGEAAGRQQGMDRINQLTIFLAEQNRTGDIIKAASDSEYQKQLLEEFSL